MPLRTLDVNGSPYVGVYCVGSEKRVFVPAVLEQRGVDPIEEALGVPARRLTIGGSTILGTLTSFNSRGALVPSFIEGAELDILREDMEVGVVEGKMNACGNNILATDKAAMVNPRLPPGARELIEDIMDVEVVAGTVASMGIVGAAASVTTRGILCHPKATDEERAALEELFGLESKIGTANYGTPLIGACLVANSKGCAVGTLTTGIELGRIEEALDLYTS